MITYYDSPIPGFGVSFKNLILDQSFYLARRIEVSTIEEIQQRLTEIYLTMERPTLLRGVYIVHYFLFHWFKLYREGLLADEAEKSAAQWLRVRLADVSCSHFGSCFRTSRPVDLGEVWLDSLMALGSVAPQGTTVGTSCGTR